MFIVKHRTIFYLFSAVLVIASLTALFVWGLKPGIDLRGGSIIEIEYTADRPEMSAVEAKLDPLGGSISLGAYSIRPTGETGYIIRTETLDQTAHDAVLTALGGSSAVQEKRFNSVGPTLGREALQKSWAHSIFR